jgi:hypothetical protein
MPSSFVRWLLAAALAAYALTAFASGPRWIAGLAALLVALLLWRRHPRARFAAYVFLSAVGARGVLTGHWAPVLFAAAVILALQTEAARRLWPRLRPGWRGRPSGPEEQRERGDSMMRP